MIPKFNESGTLPAGIHWADLDEVSARYCQNSHRKRLFSGFERGVDVFRLAGCALIYLDGSFVTEKQFPEDYDACWDPKGVNILALDRVLLEFSNRRAAQKAKYFGEFFPATEKAETSPPFRLFLNFFQNDKGTGDKKGIIGIKLQ